MTSANDLKVSLQFAASSSAALAYAGVIVIASRILRMSYRARERARVIVLSFSQLELNGAIFPRKRAFIGSAVEWWPHNIAKFT